MKYIVIQTRKVPKGHYAPVDYVCAPPGYYRGADGCIIPDGSTGGPEWTTKRDHALVFDTHRKAARVATIGCGMVVGVN